MKRVLKQAGRWGMAAAGGLLLAVRAWASEPLHGKLPHDTLVFVELDPAGLPPEGTAKGGSLLDMGVQTMSTLGVMPKQASSLADLLKLGSQWGQRHNCLAWLDADLQVDFESGGLKCNSVQVAWIVDVKGQPKEMVGALTAILGQYSTQKTARQSVKTAADKTRKYVEFYDTEWPSWIKLNWTQEGELFVLTLGEGAMERYLAERAKGEAPWKGTVAAADGAAAKEGVAGETVGRVYVATQTLRERFPDVMKLTLFSRVARALEGHKNDALLVTARCKERLLNVDVATVEEGQTVFTPWTANLSAASALVKTVPEEARYYMVFHMNWPVFYQRVVGLVDAIVPGEKRGEVQRQIDEFPRLYGVNLERDVVNKLSPLVLVHDAPQHPLHLPLMVTVLAGAKPGQEGIVKGAMAKLVGRAAMTLDRRAGRPVEVGGVEAVTTAPAEQKGEVSEWAQVRLRTDKDGVMFIQYGLAGPAWEWMDRRFIFSWSPAAVRYNATRLSSQPMQSDWFVPTGGK